MRRSHALLAPLSLLLYAFLYAPLVVVIVYSFNAGRFGVGWKGVTFEWYRGLWQNEAALLAAKNTLVLAAASTFIATVVGTLLGYGLGRYQFRGRAATERLLQVPVFIPDIIMAVALLMFFQMGFRALGAPAPAMTRMVLAHVTFQIPFVALVVRARSAGLDPSLEEAARDLGATPLQTFWHVTLPLLLPGVGAAALLAFTLSLDDFVVSFFTSGPGSTTLPILIYASAKRGITPELNALSTVLLAASVLAILTARLFHRRRR